MPLWSDRHFALIEASFRELGRVGNRWLNVPVLRNTEIGNRDDCPIRWTLKRDGSIAFDYTVLDRYLDLAVKHCGPPRVVHFVVMHGMPQSPAPEMNVLVEATGRVQAVADAHVGGGRRRGRSPALDGVRRVPLRTHEGAGA